MEVVRGLKWLEAVELLRHPIRGDTHSNLTRLLQGLKLTYATFLLDTGDAQVGMVCCVSLLYHVEAPQSFDIDYASVVVQTACAYLLSIEEVVGKWIRRSTATTPLTLTTNAYFSDLFATTYAAQWVSTPRLYCMADPVPNHHAYGPYSLPLSLPLCSPSGAP
jgi:hypothetical protein